MMLFSVIFKDKPLHGELRTTHLAAHVAWLDQHREVVLVGGSLRVEPKEVPVGGLWIVEAASKQTVRDLIKTDPFWIAGLRQEVEIFHWSKAFEDRQKMI